MTGNDVTCTERSVKNVIYSVIIKKCNEDMMDVYVGGGDKFIKKHTLCYMYIQYHIRIYKNPHIQWHAENDPGRARYDQI